MYRQVILSLVQLIAHPVRLLIRPELNRALNNRTKNIQLELQQLALTETAEYVANSMAKLESSASQEELMSKALSSVTLDGLFIEFGVFGGKSIKYIANNVSAEVYGFDSFQGLPESWRDRYTKGTFKVARLPEVPENVTLIKGWFDQTLPEFLAKNAAQAAFVHIDCDLYSSTATIFDQLKDRIAQGTVIVFDEYFNYPGWKKGEFMAFQEFLVETGLTYNYIGYNRFHEQVAVVITHMDSK